MKTKEELIEGFMSRHYALLIDANPPAYSAIKSQIEGIWKSGQSRGRKEATAIAYQKGLDNGYKKGYEDGHHRISNIPALEGLSAVDDEKKYLEDKLRGQIAKDVEDKMRCLNACQNERDIILWIIDPIRYPRKSNELHCLTDCFDETCGLNQHYILKETEN